MIEGKAGCKNITLQVPRGSVFGFLGQNGAGKSTFVRAMLGLLHPTSGKAVMLGHPIGSVEARKKVGYLPELFRYPDWLTGTQLLEHHAQLCGLSRSERKTIIRDVVEQVGMAGREKERIRGFSKGMQRICEEISQKWKNGIASICCVCMSWRLTCIRIQ